MAERFKVFLDGLKKIRILFMAKRSNTGYMDEDYLLKTHGR